MLLIKAARFSSEPYKDNSLLYSVKFSLINNQTLGNPIISLLKDFSVFLLTKTHLQCFQLIRQTTTFFEFPLDLPVWWHASMPSAVTDTFAPLLSTLTAVDFNLS